MEKSYGQITNDRNCCYSGDSSNAPRRATVAPTATVRVIVNSNSGSNIHRTLVRQALG